MAPFFVSRKRALKLQRKENHYYAGDKRQQKETITGQASDGFGEGFEQRAIQTPDGEVYAHLWSPDDSWSIQTEQELFGPRLDRYEEQKGGIALG